MFVLQMLRLALHALATIFGVIGIFAVYLSFRQPADGGTAILALGTALTMLRALDPRN
jgi:hypothetical protein